MTSKSECTILKLFTAGPSSYSNNTTSNNLQVKNQLNYSEMEWKVFQNILTGIVMGIQKSSSFCGQILELLVCAKVYSFLDIDERSEYKKRGKIYYLQPISLAP